MNYKIASFIFTIFLVFTSGLTEAALKYQQDLTFTSWNSAEDVKRRVQEFRDAAAGDPDIKIINVEYKSREIAKDDFEYNAIVTCYVSEADKDFMRIKGKMFSAKK